jgi:hypothetical protein
VLQVLEDVFAASPSPDRCLLNFIALHLCRYLNASFGSPCRCDSFFRRILHLTNDQPLFSKTTKWDCQLLRNGPPRLQRTFLNQGQDRPCDGGFFWNWVALLCDLAAQGANVVVAARRKEKLEDLVQVCTKKLVAYQEVGLIKSG